MKAAAKATYGRKGDKIVQMNYDAIDAGAKQVVEDRSSGKLERCGRRRSCYTTQARETKDVVDFVNNIQAKS